MPAIFAHYVFGREALPRMDARALPIVRSHMPFYKLGLQGPDFYFFDQLKRLQGKHLSYIGTMLHNHSCVYLLERLEHVGARRADSEELAYMLGLIGHFALDSTCHPHIDSWVKELDYDHNLIETEFDRMLLEREGEHARRFPLGSVIKSDKRTRLKVGTMYKDFSLAEDVAGLWHDFAFIKNLIRTPSDAQYRAYTKLLSMLGADALGGVLMGERSEIAPTTNLRLMPLFGQAQDVYAKLSTNFMDHVREGKRLDDYFERDFETLPE